MKVYQKVCEFCGHDFEWEVKGKGKIPKYCSKECYADAHRIMARNRKREVNHSSLPPDPLPYMEVKIKEVNKLDIAIRECREMGISYAERQKMKTLKMVGAR